MKNSKSVSTLALVMVVFVAWACSCPNLNSNNSNNTNNSNNANNSNNSNSGNSNNANNSNTRPTVPSSYITKFIVSGDTAGDQPKSNFGTTDKIYLVIGYADMPAAKGLRGKLVADAVEGTRAGASIEILEETKKGATVPPYQFYFFPQPEWKKGTYHVELLLVKEDGTEDLLKTQTLTIR